MGPLRVVHAENEAKILSHEKDLSRYCESVGDHRPARSAFHVPRDQPPGRPGMLRARTARRRCSGASTTSAPRCVCKAPRPAVPTHTLSPFAAALGGLNFYAITAPRATPFPLSRPPGDLPGTVAAREPRDHTHPPPPHTHTHPGFTESSRASNPRAGAAQDPRGAAGGHGGAPLHLHGPGPSAFEAPTSNGARAADDINTMSLMT